MVVASPPPPLVQWKAAGPGVEATNDGGRHWRVIFRGSNATVVVRTSASAGLVAAGGTAFATSDAGAHWYAVRGTPPASAVGRGPLLFFSRGADILQAVHWPLTALTCQGSWAHRNVCVGGRGVVIHTTRLLGRPANPATGEQDDVRVRALAGDQLVYDVVDPQGRTVDTETTQVSGPEESWADRDHGWRWAIRRGLEATSDGGHTWRLVFAVEPSSGGDVDQPLRMTASTGLVGVSGREFLTNDAGRHWYQVSIPAPGSFFGRGTQLYAVGGNTIEQAAVWPVRNLRCLGRWVHSAESFNLLTAGPKPRTICLQQRLTLPFRVVYSGQPTWEVVGRRLTAGVLYADVYDDNGTYDEPQVGTVAVRDGVATFTPR